MKKIINYILILVLLLPLKINAESISNYFIDAEILNTGDLKVKELFILNGSYNGYERIINITSGNNAIYDPTDFELINVKSIQVDKDAIFNDILKSGYIYEQKHSATKGDYGIYTINNNGLKYFIKIYNPDSKNEKGFYLEYLLKNIAISHNDVAELGWNIFSDELNESIKNLELKLNLPNNKNELRAWGHGPLNGYTENIDKTAVKLQISNLNVNTPIDIRAVFDLAVIYESTKKSNNSALETILAEEETKALEANAKREEQRSIEQHKENIGILINLVLITYLLGLGALIYKIYNKYDKEHPATFKTDYFRDIPASYGPEIVNYLMKKNIDSKQLSQSLLNLIADKFITFEKSDKKNLKLIRTNKKTRNLTKAEEKLMKWFFEELGNEGILKLEAVKKSAKKDYTNFLDNYNTWKNEALMDAQGYNFFEVYGKPKFLGILYSLIGIAIVIFGVKYYINGILGFLVCMSALVSIIYLISFKKRTVLGNEDYLKWKGLKKFIKDFGNFSERDLPQIYLWEKYLVYASVFGLANKLSKTMEIKFKEIYDNPNQVGNTLFDIYYFNTMLNLNQIINSSVNGAVSSALSAKSIAESRNSSSGGFGGGFSDGGGSFGGGGGGGRF